MRHRTIARLGLAAAGLITAIGPASAHHVAGGAMPTTLVEGLLSGLGHPVIGLDHLAFIVAIGIAASVAGGLGIIAAFVAASTVGVLVHVAELGLPMVEPIVAGSVIVAGAALAVGLAKARRGWLLLAIAAGLFHGYAFGESIVGAERTVIGAYLTGLAIIEIAIAVAAMMAAGLFLLADGEISTRLRTAGAVVASVGVVLLVGGLIGA